VKTATYSFLVAASLLLHATTSSAIDVGQQAPPLTVANADTALDMAQFSGKYLYLDFWASWCAPCQHSFPWMNEMQAKYGGQGLVVLAVNLDEKREDADKFLARVPAKFRIAFDPKGELATRYDVQAMPSSFFIGPNGKVIFKHAGFREQQRSELEKAVASALGKR
jgi:cytochrome c biogenesis protein CcmG/thiol:disulfide interchange protein DsbE